MTMKLMLECDGHCGANIVTERFERTFHGISGKSYGWGIWKETTVDDLLEPTGWIGLDRFTGCTYCPECWAEIVKVA